MIEEFLEICDNCGNKFSIDELTEKGLDLICIDCNALQALNIVLKLVQDGVSGNIT